MAKTDILVGLDIGTTKIVAIVAEIYPDTDEIRIIGVGEVPSPGLRKGVIVDIEGTAKAISVAVASAEQMSGFKIDSCIVGITGPHIASVNNRGVVAVKSQHGEITIEDAKRVLGASKIISLPPDRRIIHVLPREYIVDGYDGIVDPIGMTGSRLEVEANIVTGAAASIQNTLKTLEKADLNVLDIVLNPLASSEAVLLPAERELAAIVVDVGGGTTDLAIFDNNGLFYTAVIPIGGDHVTNDLAVGLRTPLDKAEEIKIEHGCVLENLMPDENYIPVTNIDGHGSKEVSKKKIASIIEPRIQELFYLIKNEIRYSNFKGLIPGGVIFTGGSVLIDGFVELAAKELDMPVRIGFPTNTSGLSDIVSSTSYATSIGLLKYGARYSNFKRNTTSKDHGFKNLIKKIREWFKDFI